MSHAFDFLLPRPPLPLEMLVEDGEDSQRVRKACNKNKAGLKNTAAALEFMAARNDSGKRTSSLA